MQSLDTIKAVIDDGVLTINERDYHIMPTTHSRRVVVFGFLSSIKEKMAKGDFEWLNDTRFEKVSGIIEDMVTFEDGLISKDPKHWDNYAEDYLIFITTMLTVVSYPFLKGQGTNLQGTHPEKKQTT